MQFKERLLYIGMLVAGGTWLATLILAFLDANLGFRPSWAALVGGLLFVASFGAIIATLIVSVWVIAVGPRAGRIAVAKWLGLLVLSMVTANHLIPLWVPITFSTALALFPAWRLWHYRAPYAQVPHHVA
jgi:hypothetical protein